MGGPLGGGEKNIFPNQFNLHADLDSAKRFLEVIKDKRIPLKLVPTECIKGSKFELDQKELEQVLKDAPEVKSLGYRWWKGSGSKEPDRYKLFDWVAALIVKNPDLLHGKW